MKIAYIDHNFNAASSELIDTANGIIQEYAGQGFDLTLRQLYYQLVARDVIPNTQKEYKRVGSLFNKARLAGLMSWESIVDRTRNLQRNSHWSSPASILRSAARSYDQDRWAGQRYRPEVWIEKDALIGVISGVCTELDVPFFSCRGYTSQSEMWAAGHHRLKVHSENGQMPFIIHLADHDPSGIDMTRDMADRLAMFAGWDSFELERIALNMPQVERYGPPPNPAKITDSRAKGYIAEYGRQSWELDALEPRVLEALIRSTVEDLIEWDYWNQVESEVLAHREKLELLAARYSSLDLED